MNKGDIFTLSEIDIQIVELVAHRRQKNKEDTCKNGLGTAAIDNKHLERNIIGFGAEYLFCKSYNLFPDFSIGNTSKLKGTDPCDAILGTKTIDVKTSTKDYPLMTPHYSISNCNIFALFYCIYPKYRFEGFATNNMLFNKQNLKKKYSESYILKDSYVLPKKYLLEYNQLGFEKKHNK